MTKEGDQLYKGRGSIKILSTQVGGASSLTCMLHLNGHFTYLLAWHKSLISISMLVWCMLVVGLNVEMKN